VSIKLTPRAAEELKTLMKQEVDAQKLSASAVLRLMVAGGGCSGFTYRMGFDENITPQDAVEEVEGVKVAVDDKSALYLDGTEVDYHDGLMGRGFVFNNPNAAHTCGCNKSCSA
jgi:iron-sulfur cluster assembly protein